MTQGVQIPIQTATNNTVTVSFKDAALTLKVTPQITAANTVIMQIALENATPDFRTSVNGIPPINTQRAITTVLVLDGQTTVIGGIYTSSSTTTRDQTPGLGSIPLLGWLFKRESITDANTELLIFITPTNHQELMSTKLMPIRTVVRCAAALLLAAAATSCGDVVRSSRSPVMLVVNLLQAAPGQAPENLGATLSSDVVTNVTTPAPCTPDDAMSNDLQRRRFRGAGRGDEGHDRRAHDE